MERDTFIFVHTFQLYNLLIFFENIYVLVFITQSLTVERKTLVLVIVERKTPACWVHFQKVREDPFYEREEGNEASDILAETYPEPSP